MLNSEYTHLKKTDAAYGTLHRDIEFYRGSFENRENTRLARERQLLEDEQQQLALTKEHIEMNLKNIDEEQENTEKSIERQTMEHQGDFKRLTEKNKLLHKEIEDLRAQLELKLLEKKTVEKDLAVVTEKIDVVRAKYGKQLEKVATKKERALDELSHNEADLQKLASKLDSVSEQEALVRDKLQEYLSQQEAAQAAREAIKAELSTFDEDRARKEQVNRVVAEKRQALELERVCLKELVDSIASTDSEIKKAEAEIEVLEQTAKSVEEKVPQLEKEKKVAATARNFLEANKLAKEIKEKKEEVDNIARAISVLKQTREHLTTSLPETAAKLAAKEAAVQKAKCEYDVVMFRVLEIRAADLLCIKRFFEEHQAAADLDGEALDQEIDWCAQQRAMLYAQYRDQIDRCAEQTPAESEELTHTTDDAPAEQLDAPTPLEEPQQVLEEPAEAEETGAEEQLSAEEVAEMVATLQAEFDRVEKEIEEAAEHEQFELADQLNSANSQRKQRLDQLAGWLARAQLAAGPASE